ncbi:MAG TPA: hypothetical protein DCQ68_22165 [Chryseobacterium indologenes]|uniref:hypothetical protein n=2 Tax=Chryseobacterium indologenes TaxID=253 RepID=UPI000EBCA490|nr:hypothetical protein [Chryseobacterium indologenes]QIX81139.1 hypothetical protein FOB56_07795 [Chryseobacterium indologenes]HAO29594.1 hypothetical protein [Chryseobacterium indologenes]
MRINNDHDEKFTIFFCNQKFRRKKITYQNCNVLLTKNDLAPFSFWNIWETAMQMTAILTLEFTAANISAQKGIIKSVAYIHIDATGKTTDIQVSGENETFNKELLQTVTGISNETMWIPATENGKAVAAVLKLPATMSFGHQ